MRKNRKSILFLLILTLLLSLFWACSHEEKSTVTVVEDKNEAAAFERSSEPAEGVEAQAVTASEDEQPEKIVYTFEVNLETLDATGMNQRVEALVREFKGIIESAGAWGLNDRSAGKVLPSFNYTLKIPTERVEEFVERLSELGDVQRLERYRENMSTTYYDTEARVKNKRAEEERIRELLKEAENMEDIIALESRLSELREEIEYLEGTMRQIDRDVARSTVYLNIRQVEEFTSTFNRRAPFKDRVARYFEISYETLRNGGEFLLYFLIVFGPWLILILLIVVIIVIISRNKAEKKRRRYLEDQKQIAAMYVPNRPQQANAPLPQAQAYTTPESKVETPVPHSFDEPEAKAEDEA